ncbi:Polyketide cyclase / dehydrase and lipid transport [Pseudonocardia ammonioxydans]|uniref:Polyketide cyclase / dehydrase and lipid transport n=1 Tax=Pseudonocardia ammonioxydans TaxID=260086 RepID=A0A1I5G171_PSUAM|nr:SRPBCC family protein [Pseudonocardia ammonioxydans]SFO29623.1 Polyketide cyclase / dehydrase and lipid transport [Pseudonocardia ammonioxydans]
MRYADGPTTEAEIRVEAAPGDVWALVTDLGFLARVSTEMQHAEWADGTAPGPGARIHGEHRHEAVGTWRTTATVTGWEPGRIFEWTVEPDQDGGPAAVWRFELTPDGAGTRLRQWARMGPGPSGLSGAIAHRPEKEERIVAGRLEEWRTGMARNLDAVRDALTG